MQRAPESPLKRRREARLAAKRATSRRGRVPTATTATSTAPQNKKRSSRRPSRDRRGSVAESGGLFFFGRGRDVGRAEFVAGAAERIERQGFTEFGAETPNVDVDGARAAVVAIAPDAREQVFA